MDDIDTFDADIIGLVNKARPISFDRNMGVFFDNACQRDFEENQRT